MHFLKKVLAIVAYYLFSPITVYIHLLRGVKIKDRKSLFVGIHVDIDHLYPQHVSIGKNVTIAAGTRITAHTTPPAIMRSMIAKEIKDVVIGNNVFIGVDAIILPGVLIDDWVVVGAGAVVTKNISSYSIVAGNPAQVVGQLMQDKQVEL